MAFTTGVGWAPPLRPSSARTRTLNFNGVLDSGDNNQNMDGMLWPGQSAAFTLDNNGVTDSSGFVVLRVRHGQRFAFWAEYQIEARAATAGSDAPTTYNYTTVGRQGGRGQHFDAGLSPSARSGTAAVCSDPN